MKKAICFVLICLMLFGMAACGKTENGESSVTSSENVSSDTASLESSATVSSEPMSESTSNSTEESNTLSEPEGSEESNDETSNSILYKPHSSLPSYTVTVVYKDEDTQTAETIIVTEQASGKEAQTITVDFYNERFTKEPAYAVDVTFDGYADLLIPNQEPAHGPWFHAFVWDVETNQLIFAPGFSELPNVALDTERKQILHHRLSDRITSYGISVYDSAKKDFIGIHSLCWDWSDDEITYFEESEWKNGKWKTVKEFTFSSDINFNQEYPRAKPYYEEGSVWELGSSKWKNLLIDDSKWS